MKSKTVPATDAALARLLSPVEPLSPDDDVTRAAVCLREHALTAYPVGEAGALLGVVTERAVLQALAIRGVATEPLRGLLTPATVVPVGTSLAEALWLLQRDDVDGLVVQGDDGRYLGVVSRSRVILAAEDTYRPATVGGMATPLGVHLTDGDRRGGAGDIALVLTGAYLFVLLTGAQLAAAVLVSLASGDPQQAMLSQLSPALVDAGAVPPPGLVAAILPLLLFLLFIRLSPLAGYHSGEHQTVHALERGLPLTAEHVARMPRPHLRCGTNYAVLIGLLMLFWSVAAGGSPAWVALPGLALLFYWRRVGLGIQHWFTTRPASRRQIEAGIHAAKLLIGRYQRNPERRASRVGRIWNRGIVQVFLGGVMAHYASDWLRVVIGNIIVGA
jgi:CBS domain-containing protein